MWTKDLFNTEKPVIGMLHLLGMPTDPKYDNKGGMQKVIERARRDLAALQNGGVDGIIFCNEFSIPYVTNVSTVTVACMARIIGELLSEIRVPFGVDVAIDPYKTLDLAAAVGASFVRETFTGVYAGEYGLHSNDLGRIERHRNNVGCKDIRILTTLVPEGEKMIIERPIEDIAKAITHLAAPDALLVYGLTAGRGIDSSIIPKVKEAVNTPVFASNGVRIDTVEEILSIADGCVVGTWFKYDGNFFNETDETRVSALMKKVRAIRKEH